MSSRTATQVIDIVIANLGDREPGRIGAMEVREYLLSLLNDVLIDVARSARPIELYHKFRVSFSNTGYEVAVPTADVLDVSGLRIRNILNGSILKDQETVSYPMEYYAPTEFEATFPGINSALHSGRPTAFTMRRGYLSVFPYPDGNYFLTFDALCWPAAITIDQTLPYSDDWNDVVEAGVTFRAFAALQLDGDANLWSGMYQSRLQRNRAALEESSAWNPRMPFYPRNIISHNGGDPALDPFVRRV